jgi:excisionase family DNA binding protein
MIYQTPPPQDPRPGLWTADDVARYCRVSVRTVRQWQAERRIPFLKMRRIVRFDPAAVLDALGKFEIIEVGRPRHGRRPLGRLSKQ